jgi:hypothetical protein
MITASEGAKTVFMPYTARLPWPASVRASEDSSCLRPGGHCDRRRVFTQGLKCSEHEDKDAILFITEVTNAWSLYPQYVFVPRCLNKQAPNKPCYFNKTACSMCSVISTLSRIEPNDQTSKLVNRRESNFDKPPNFLMYLISWYDTLKTSRN